METSEINSECSNCSIPRMRNSVKTYSRHIISCELSENSMEWPRAVEDDPNSFIGKISKDLNSKKDKKNLVKLTACSLSSRLDGLTDVIVFPENVIFHLAPDDINDFSSLILDEKRLQTKDFSQFNHSKAPFAKLLLVCIHGSRDRRCFEHGSSVLQAMKDYLKSEDIPESEIAVRASSHIGGHEFAGTLIVYPEAQWYGNLSAAKVPTLMQHVREGRTWEACYRGNGGCIGNANATTSW